MVDMMNSVYYNNYLMEVSLNKSKKKKIFNTENSEMIVMFLLWPKCDRVIIAII